MKTSELKNLANSFPDKFETGILNSEISLTDFTVFEKGIFSSDMDEKWNIFVIQNCIYFVRSWTNYCIFKVTFEKINAIIKLTQLQVNRDEQQNKSKDILIDIERVERLIQSILKHKNGI